MCNLNMHVICNCVNTLHDKGFPSGSVIKKKKKSTCQCRKHSYSGSVPGSGRSPGKGNSNPLQYSCLENSMNRGAWWTTVHRFIRVGHNWATNTQTYKLLTFYPIWINKIWLFTTRFFHVFPMNRIIILYNCRIAIS